MNDLPPELLLEPCSPPLRAIADDLRAVVRVAEPAALERVRTGWGVIGYDVPVGRRTRFFAWIWAQPEHVHLGFVHGVLVTDPERLLGGGGVTKLARWLTFEPGDRVDGDRLVPLIREAARVSGLSRGERRVALEAMADAPGW